MPLGLVIGTIGCSVLFVALLIVTLAWLVPQKLKADTCNSKQNSDPSQDCTDFIALGTAGIPLLLGLGLAFVCVCVGAVAIVWHQKCRD